MLVISDLHDDNQVVEKIYQRTSNNFDALIICGDLTHYGDLNTTKKIIKGMTKLGVPILFLPRNCDPVALPFIHSVYGAINLHGRNKNIGDLDFVGVGGCPPSSFNTPFEILETTMTGIIGKAYLNVNQTNTVVLVSYAPPINTKVDITSFGEHVGSRALRTFIETKKLALVLCGPIHEARGIDSVEGVSIVNPGPAYRGFFALVDIDRSRMNVKADLEAL